MLDHVSGIKCMYKFITCTAMKKIKKVLNWKKKQNVKLSQEVRQGFNVALFGRMTVFD